MLKIYITDLAAYNEGFLSGEWVSLPMGEDELNEKIKEVLSVGSALCENEEHEEFFITDYEFETEFSFAEVGEYSNPFTLNETAESLSDLVEGDMKRVSYLIDNCGYDLAAALEKYEDVIIYEDMRLIDVVEEYVNETVDFTNIPSLIANNIDYESIKVDFEISGEYEEIGSDVYYFVN